MIVFEDGEIQIRAYTPGDLAQQDRLLTDPVTMQHWPAPFSPAAVERWREQKITAYHNTLLGRWAVIQLQENTLIGDAGIVHSQVNGRAENDLGYILDHRYWGKGLGSRIAAACMKHGFEVAGLERIIAHMASNHLPSRGVAEKIGMKWELQFVNSQNRGFTHELYALSKADYFSS